ncbi:MAG: pyridoxal-dependent decarboxylase, partial [Pyrinomonadaceae bacterium]
MSALMLDEDARAQLWHRVFDLIEEHARTISAHAVAPVLNLEEIRGALEPFDFEQPLDALSAVDFAAQGMWQYQVHTPHPRYFGLFNPAPTTMGIAADALVAAFNPQIAAWSHSPFAAEVERHLVRAFGLKFGYEEALIDGTFASGGAEANHTALLTALVNSFPRFAREGVRALSSQPVFYVTDQSHHSFLKAARLSGLGTDAAREIPTDDDLKMNVNALASQIKRDRAEGFAPFMVVATAGTTNAGVIDPIEETANVADDEKLWLHTDAAWGGAVAIVGEMRSLLEGIERADSITFDAHKWL